MRYNDIFGMHLPRLIPCLKGEFITGDFCLVWTANYEHAVFYIADRIHPAAVYVWLQTYVPTRMISKFQKLDGKWKRVEQSEGRIPLVNNNPFDPRLDNAASNTAVSVFPQNK